MKPATNQNSITKEDVINAAVEHIKTHNTICPRDVHHRLIGRKPHYRHAATKSQLLRISRILRSNGFVCVDRKTKGYSRYALKGERATDDKHQ